MSFDSAGDGREKASGARARGGGKRSTDLSYFEEESENFSTLTESPPSTLVTLTFLFARCSSSFSLRSPQCPPCCCSSRGAAPCRRGGPPLPLLLLRRPRPPPFLLFLA